MLKISDLYTACRDRKLVHSFLYILLFSALILLLSGDLTWPLIRVQEDQKQRVVSTGRTGSSDIRCTLEQS